MKNAFLVLLSIIVAIFIVVCSTMLVLMQFPDIGEKFLNKNFSFNNKTQIETTNPYIEHNTIEETTEEEKWVNTETTVSYNIDNYVQDNANISYPVVYGMSDLKQQAAINNKLYINACSVVVLYPIDTKNQTLSITPEVVDINDRYITVVYSGQLSGKASKTSSKSTNNSSQTTKKSTSGSSNRSSNDYYNGSSKYSDNPSNNYQLPAGGMTPQIPSNNLPNIQIPGSLTNPFGGIFDVITITPGTPVVGYSSTNSSDAKKIYYTNTIDLTYGIDLKLNDYINPSDLAKYIRKDSVEFYKTNADENDIKKYIKNISESNWTKTFTDCDFRNTGLKSWPKSFSYVLDNDIYAMVPLNSKLGDYCIIKYNYSK